MGVTTLGSLENNANDKPTMFLHLETNMGVLIKLQQANHCFAQDKMLRAIGTWKPQGMQECFAHVCIGPHQICAKACGYP